MVFAFLFTVMIIKVSIIIETFMDSSNVCTDNKLVVFFMFQYNHNIECTIHNISPGNYCYYVSIRFVCLILTLVL
jgi:hypothetical protein